MKPVGWIFCLALTTAVLVGCGQKADSAVDKAATDAKDKMVADAKAAESLVKAKEAQETGIAAYIHAYPLVTMEMTRRVSTNVTAPDGSLGRYHNLDLPRVADDSGGSM
jgi:hypothetical protein